MGTSILVTSSPPSTNLNVNTSPNYLTWVYTLIDSRWNYFLWASVKKSSNSTLAAMNLWEQAKMGYLLKFILFLSTCKHYFVFETKNECLGPCGLFYFIFYFPFIINDCFCACLIFQIIIILGYLWPVKLYSKSSKLSHN